MEPAPSPRHSKKDRQQQVALAIRNIWSFLESYIPLANTHGADFITQRHWETQIPETWRQQLAALTRPQLVLLSQYGLDPGASTLGTRGPGQQQHPATTHDAGEKDDGSLSSFITAAARCRLENTSTLSSISDIADSTERIDVFKKENNNLCDVVREGMSEKKNHEIEAISSAVMSLITHSHAQIIMDVGSGKGYLGCELSLRQKVPVIGLDSCATNTRGALMRDEKLTQRWQKQTRSRETKLRNVGSMRQRVADISKSAHHSTTDMPDCSVTSSLPVQVSHQASCISHNSDASIVSGTHQVSHQASCISHNSDASIVSGTHQVSHQASCISHNSDASIVSGTHQVSHQASCISHNSDASIVSGTHQVSHQASCISHNSDASIVSGTHQVSHQASCISHNSDASIVSGTHQVSHQASCISHNSDASIVSGTHQVSHQASCISHNSDASIVSGTHQVSHQASCISHNSDASIVSGTHQVSHQASCISHNSDASIVSGTHQVSHQASCISHNSDASIVSGTHQALVPLSQSCAGIEALAVDVPPVEGQTCASCCLDLSNASLEDTAQSAASDCGRTSADGRSCGRASADGRSCGRASSWRSPCERCCTQNGESGQECAHSQLGTARQYVNVSLDCCRPVGSPLGPGSSRKHRGDQKPDPAVTRSGMSLYVPLTLAVHPDMNLAQIMEDHAWKVGITQPASAGILCTGLHACGSLSVTALRLFVQNPAVVGLCVVGCCYQLMEEACLESADEVPSQSPEAHFPLSEFGQQLGLNLGRNARNLASQSVDRMQQSGQLQGADFCWRAMLELLLQELEVPVPERIVGMRKLHKRSSSFLEYVGASLSKLNLDPGLASPELVASVEDRCKGTADKMAAFVQVKLVLAPVIEALVLLDRYLYLLQQDSIQDAHIVQLFDPVISPRCYAILAWK